jgi:hypothetical protein
MQNDQTEGSRVSFFLLSLTRSAGREGAHHVFTSFIKSIFDGRGDGNAEERRGGEARRERRKKFCLLVCFAYLPVCFRVSFAAVTVSPFLLSFSSLGHSPWAPCRRIK